MIKRWPQTMMALGTIFLVIGIVAFCLKVNSDLKLADLTSGNPNYIRPEPTGFDVFIIRFPGIEFLIVGAILQIAGFLAARLWNVPDSRK